MNTVTTLHRRLDLAISVRLMIAKAATPGPWTYATVRGVTSVGAADTLPSVAADVAFDADVHHLLANSPDVVIRQCEADLRRLGRHQPNAVESEAAGLCAYGWHEAWPCDDIRDLAAVYAVEVVEEGEPA